MNLQHIVFILALLVPLSIDAFILSAVLGLAGLPKKDQLRTSLVLSAFEAGMPAVGVLIGHFVGSLIGHYASYVAAAVIGIAGLMMLKPEKTEAKEETELKLLSSAKGLAIINLGFSISIDELAIGLSLGLLHISLLLVMVYIGVQTFIFSRLGLWLGARLGEKLRERAELTGGIILVVVAIVLIVARATGHQL